MNKRESQHDQPPSEIEELRARVAQLETTLRLRDRTIELLSDHRLLDHVHDAIIIVDSTTRIMTWNRAAEAIYGWQAKEAIGRRLGELIPTHYAEGMSSAIAVQQLRQQSYWRGEVIQTHRDGHELFIENSTQLLRDSGGEVAAYVGINRDISERKRAEIRQRLLLEASLLLAESLDYETTLANVVRAAVPTFGDMCFVNLLQPDGELRRALALHADPAKQTLLDELGERYPIARQPQHPVNQVLRDGRSLLLTSSMRPALDSVAIDDHHLLLLRAIRPAMQIIVAMKARGHTLGVLSFGLDGTRRRYDADDLALAEELAHRAALAIEHAQLYAESRQALQRADEALALLDALYASAQVGLGFLDRDLRYQRVNRYLAELKGMSVEAHVGRLLHEVHPDLRRTAEPLLRQVIENGAPITDIEIAIELPGRPGQMHTWQSSYYPVRLAGGAIVGVGVVSIDISARKRAEEERLSFERKLLETQKLESIGVLAGGIAHDFNNLLVSILGHTELALLDIEPHAPARESIEHIQVAGQRAADLTRQLLAYVGRGQLATQPVNITSLIEEMSHLLQTVVGKTTTLCYHLAADLPSVEADVTQLRQIVMNLVVNASEAIGASTGTISIATGELWLDQPALRELGQADELAEGQYVYLEVADTGVGMDPATRARIFEPFFTTKFTGRGLGLSAVQGIVLRHNGVLKVQSEPGRGSSFRLMLPTTDQSAEPLPRPGAPGARWQHHGTVLVVDDEADVRATVAAMLRRFGLNVLTAEDGLAGVALFERHHDTIGCVLLDMTMPRMRGDEAFRQIRRIKPSAQVIVMSGYTEEDSISRFADQRWLGSCTSHSARASCKNSFSTRSSSLSREAWTSVHSL
jgi:PAS domain S-box-containing protein